MLITAHSARSVTICSRTRFKKTKKTHTKVKRKRQGHLDVRTTWHFPRTRNRTQQAKRERRRVQEGARSGVDMGAFEERAGKACEAGCMGVRLACMSAHVHRLLVSCRSASLRCCASRHHARLAQTSAQQELGGVRGRRAGAQVCEGMD